MIATLPPFLVKCWRLSLIRDNDTELLDVCAEAQMPYLLKFYCDKFGSPKKYVELAGAGIEQTQLSVSKLELEVEENIKKKQSESRIAETRMDIADMRIQSGDVTGALALFDTIGHKSLSATRKFNFLLIAALLCLAMGQQAEAEKHMAAIQPLEVEVDFERRNLLKLLRGLLALAKQDFSGASAMLTTLLVTYSDALIAVMSYEDYTRYTLLALLLDPGYDYRAIQTFRKDPNCQYCLNMSHERADALLEISLFNALTSLNYAAVFRMLPRVQEYYKNDFIVRYGDSVINHIKTKVYTFYLASFKRADLGKMAAVMAFPSTNALVDDLYFLIGAGYLRVKLDTVAKAVWLVNNNNSARALEMLQLTDVLAKTESQLNRMETLIDKLATL